MSVFQENKHDRDRGGRFTEMAGSAPEGRSLTAPHEPDGQGASLPAPSEALEDGTLVWRDSEGRPHRTDGGPAVIYPDGEQVWMQEGRYRRDGGLPHVEHPDGTSTWQIDGIELSGPTKDQSTARATPVADRLPDGTMVWRNSKGEPDSHGDLPAAVYADGRQAWYRDGMLHRDGGKPAIEHPDGRVEHWVNGSHLDRSLPPKEAAAIASNTQKQIGVGALMSVGARNLQHDQDGSLVFQCTSERRTSTVRIALDADDTYTVTLSRPKHGDRFTTERVEHVTGVYNDSLSRVVLGFDR